MALQHHEIAGLPAWALGFLLGLLFGSFAQATVWRLIHGVPYTKGRSRCPVCGTVLGPVELIPVLGWILLRGRCRHCESGISVSYPLGEFALGVLLGAAAYFFQGKTEHLAGLWWGLMALWVVAVVDIKTMLVFPGFLLFGGAVGTVLMVVSGPPEPWGRHLVGALAAGGGFWLLSWLAAAIAGEEALGQGDVVLAFWIGWFLGIEAVPWWALASFMLGGVIGIPVYLWRLYRGAPNARQLPFGPFMALGAALLWVVGPEQVILTFFRISEGQVL